MMQQTAQHQWDLVEAGESYIDVNNYLHDQKLTDGLPVIPPEPHLVEKAIRLSGRAPDEVIATVAPSFYEATVEKIAANAVMAGCEPKHMPVVIAAVEAVTDPSLDLKSMQATTYPGGPMIVVNGPARKELGINCGFGILAPGFRANAAIGRALRLILMNIGDARPGELDLATHGYPGKYTMCFGENEEVSPWEPYHVEHGWSAEQTTVTIMFVGASINVLDSVSTKARGLMTTLVGSVMHQGSNNYFHGGKGHIDVILGPEFATAFAAEGYTKQKIRQQIWDEAVIPLSAFDEEVAAEMVKKDRPSLATDPRVRITDSPDDIHIFVAGGQGRHTIVAYGPRSNVAMREVKLGDRPVGRTQE